VGWGRVFRGSVLIASSGMCYGIGIILVDDIKEILEINLGESIEIKIWFDRTIRGVLEGYDEHLNLYLKESEDVSDPGNVVGIGDIVLRGDTVVMVRSLEKDS
jgi:small nuclear ribonucleoprotein